MMNMCDADGRIIGVSIPTGVMGLRVDLAQVAASSLGFAERRRLCERDQCSQAPLPTLIMPIS